MVNVALLIDLALLIVGAGAIIAGTTPPVPLANQEEKSKASKDFVQKYGISSNFLVYSVHGWIVLFTLIQFVIVLQADRTNSTLLAKQIPSNQINQNWLKFFFKVTSSSSNEKLQPRLTNTQAWLFDQRIRSWFRINSLLSIIGGILRVICFRALGHFFTFDLAIRKGHKVIQTGPYAYVRHPSYSAMILLTLCHVYSLFVYGPLIGANSRSLAWNVITFFLMIPAVFITLRIRDEESMLQKELGKEYKEYMQKVPVRLVPYLF